MLHPKEHTIFILTAVYRDQNLGKIAESIRPLHDLFNVVWLPIFDTEFGNWHAGAKYNRGLDIVKSITESWDDSRSWLYFLDDDNLIHPEFGQSLFNAIQAANPEDWFKLMFIMDQYMINGAPRLQPPVVEQMKIDTACVIPNAFASRRLSCRWRMDDNTGTYTFDYYYINRLVKHGGMLPSNVPGKVYYNAITGQGTANRNFDKNAIKETIITEKQLYGNL